MDGFKNGVLIANVRTGNKAQPPNESRAKIGDDVAVKILQQQYIVLIRIHHQLHAGVVHNVLAVSDLWVLLRNIP